MTSSLEHQVTQYPDAWVPVRDPVASLIDDLRAARAGGTVRIFSGEGSPAVYNHPLFLQTAKELKEKSGLSYQVSLGPLVVADGGAFNGLLYLHKRRVVRDVTYRPIRGDTPHFRLVETENGYRYYIESPHLPLVATSQRRTLDVAALSESTVQRMAEEARALFDDVVKTRLETEHFWATAPRPAILATALGLRLLVETAQRRGRRFNSLTAVELQSLLQQETTSWTSVERATALHPGHWVLMRVVAFDEHSDPSHGQVIISSPFRAEVSKALANEPPRSSAPTPTATSHYIFFTRRLISSGPTYQKAAHKFLSRLLATVEP